MVEGFNAMGQPVPFIRQEASYQEAKKVGIPLNIRADKLANREAKNRANEEAYHHD